MQKTMGNWKAFTREILKLQVEELHLQKLTPQKCLISVVL
jgi:hypothetical protein